MNTPFKFDHDQLKLDHEQLKFDPETRPKASEKRPRQQRGFRFKQSDYRAHYAEIAAQGLLSIVRQRRLIGSFVAFALVLACLILPLLPRKYSAEALIYPNLLSREEVKVVAVASVDGSAMVTGEARLIRSDEILRSVAKQLGNDPKEIRSSSWATQSLDSLRAMFLPEIGNPSPLDRTVAMLRNKVVVMNDTRSYLISISFTASSAEEAARVVNAFATEYLRDKIKQRRMNKVNSVEAELRQQQAVYGAKHPKTLQALAELDAERAALEAAMKSQHGDEEEVANDQSIKLAVPSHMPTSPKGFVILGLSFLSSLLAGIGLAIWRGRKEVAGGQPHTQ